MLVRSSQAGGFRARVAGQTLRVYSSRILRIQKGRHRASDLPQNHTTTHGWATPAVGEPEARPLRLLLRHLEAFLPPNRIHAILSHVPPLISQESRHRTVAVPPVLLGQCDDPLAHSRALVSRPRYVPIGAPDLANRPTRSDT